VTRKNCLPRAKDADQGDVELIDLRDYPLPFFDAPPPAKAPREYATEEVARLGRTLDRADGFIVLTAEYNHGAHLARRHDRGPQAGEASDTTAFAPLEPKLKLLADDLTWWAAALAAARVRDQR
jgi:hypothetical protein